MQNPNSARPDLLWNKMSRH